MDLSEDPRNYRILAGLVSYILLDSPPDCAQGLTNELSSMRVVRSLLSLIFKKPIRVYTIYIRYYLLLYILGYYMIFGNRI
jgi:hypothetical protein